jgi:hypothetical protein
LASRQRKQFETIAFARLAEKPRFADLGIKGGRGASYKNSRTFLVWEFL